MSFVFLPQASAKFDSSKKNLGITSSIQHISKCIQVIDKMVYIPNLNNNFIVSHISVNRLVISLGHDPFHSCDYTY